MLRRNEAGLACLISTIFTTLPAYAGQDVTADALPDAVDIPVVLSPAKLRQSLADVPASVTVITQEMMRKYGVTSVVEALRLVPGMEVTQVGGSDYRVNYHGGNILVPRQMDVLIDGVSAYRPALARMDWKALPVVVEDIDRIEVTRAPDSASYGANAMTAVVNIITKSPETVHGTVVAAEAGSHGRRQATIRQSGSIGENTQFRVTVDRQADNGYDLAQGARGNDRSALNRLNYYSTTKIGSADTVDIQGAIVQGLEDAAYADAYQKTMPNQGNHDYYLNFTWKRSVSATHDFQVQAYASLHELDQEWITCPPAAMFLPQMYALWAQNPSYVNTILRGAIPHGGTAQDDVLAAQTLQAIHAMGKGALAPRCVRTNQNYAERRYNLEVQDTQVVSDALRFVNGVRVRQDSTYSETYLNGYVSNSTLSLFSNIEYKPSKWATVNAGGYLERDELTGSEFSPRLAVNLHPSPNNSFRFVASKGTRMPDIQEQRANWSYRATDVTPIPNAPSSLLFFQNAHAPRNLEPEHIISYETGYFGNFPERGVRVDAKVFYDRLYNLISEKLQVASFLPTNNGRLTQKGYEVQVNYDPVTDWSMYGTFSRLIDSDVSNPVASTQYAPKSGTFGITKSIDNVWDLSFVVYKAYYSGLQQNNYGRQDVVLSRTYKLPRNMRLVLTLKASNFDNKAVAFYKDVTRSAIASYSNGRSGYVSANLSF